MLKALLVDMDGTLVQSAHANAAAYAMALSECGITVNIDKLAPLIDGRSWRDFLPELTAARSDVIPEQVARRKRVLYPSFFHLLQLNELLAELIRLLHGKLATALVTTASSMAVGGILERFAIADLFDVIVSGDNVTQAKPHPEGYIRAASQLGLTPEECMLIEDSETGMRAAQAFGGGLLRWCPAVTA